MFKLLRYFSIASMLAFAVVVGALGLFYRQSALDDLMMIQERQHVALSRALSNSVWPEFEPFIRSASGLSADDLRAHPEVGRLREAVLRQIRGSGVVKVKIYNLEGLTVFSTEDAQIGADQSQNAGFLSARGGGVASELTHRATFSAFDKLVEDRDLFSSYVPLRSAEGSAPAAVFEIYTDVTPFLQQIA